MKTSSPTQSRFPPRMLAALITVVATFLVLPAEANADESRSSLWLMSGEVGVGPVDDEVFFHLTPRLTYLRPVPAPMCDETTDCTTFFETSLHIPLRLAVTDRDDGVIRRQDWLEVSDFFRILRRAEYGSPERPLHVRLGEIGPVQLGHGTIVNGYYNVVTTDHYRLGVTGHLETDRWGTELFVNDLTSPNLGGVRARYRPPRVYEEDSDWRRFSFGSSLVADVSAPTRLASSDNRDQLVAGPGLHPVVDEHRPTAIAGLDARWKALDRPSWSVTPYTDFNHHFGLGSGLHTGVLWDHDIDDTIRLSSRLEYRLLAGHYLPDYFDPVYEITRFRHPHLQEPDTGYPGPKLRAAASTEARTRHGGFAQVQTRIGPWLTLSGAFSDATGSTGADLRLRASVDYEDRLGVGLFFYQFAPGDQNLGDRVGNLVGLDGALTALEGRYTLWGPLYLQGRFARKWRLHEDGRFDNVHLWDAGLGAGTRF